MTDDTPLTCDRLADVLDDVLDGRAGAEAGGFGRAAIETHLAGCASCQTLVADVRAIRAAARTLDAVEPPEHVWHAVRARVGAEPAAIASPFIDRVAARLGASRRVYQPLAAAAMFVLMASGLAWVGTRLESDRAPGAPVETAADGSRAEFQLAEAEYTEAIARLEEAAASARPPALDAMTSATLESSIDDIDAAIGDARDALQRQPGDELSQESLLGALGSKVTLLQDTVALLGEIDERAEERNP
jgi:hypothetical protein